MNKPNAEEEKKKQQPAIGFKIAQDETWKCDLHKASKTFYCLVHDESFCPGCLKLKHKDCYKIEHVLDEDEARKRLLGRCEELKAEVAVKQADAETLMKDYNTVGGNAKGNKELHEKLYDLIKSHMDGLAEKTKESKSKTDQELIDNGVKVQEKIAKKQGVYSGMIKSYEETSKTVAELSLKDIIIAYQNLKTLDSVECTKEHTDLRSEITAFESSVTSAKIDYKKPLVTAQLDTAFNRIHGLGIAVSAEQGTADFTFVVSQLSPLLCLYDLNSCFVARKALARGGKPYHMPYGVGIVSLPGRIFITGGTSDLANHLADCLEYSLLKDELVTRKSMKTERSEHGATAVGEDVFCVGGRNGTGCIETCEIYSASTKSWTDAKSLSEKKAFVSLCVFREAKKVAVYAFGGVGSEGHYSTRVEKLVWNGGEGWKVLGDFMNYVETHSLGCVQTTVDGTTGILLLGGVKKGNVKSREAYFYVPASEQPGAKPSLQKQERLELPKDEDLRGSPPAVQRGTGKVYVVCQTQLYTLGKDGWLKVVRA